MKSTRNNWSKMHRRAFMKTMGVVGPAAMGLLPAWTMAAEQRDASQIVAGKDKRLIVHESDIVVLETPPELLDAAVTPLDVLFVRNNQHLDDSATLKPFPLEDWKIELAGQIDAPRKFNAAMLSDMEQVEQEMVLQCSGNGRSLFAQTVEAKGTQWTRGGMGNIRVSGVKLSAVLDKLGVRIDRSARFLTAEGKDSPPADKEDFEHSLPLDDALEHSLLALTFNGQPIPAVHGGPVRLMTPGYFGTMHIKWLSRLRFESDETDNYNQIPRYRTPRRLIEPGTPITYTFENSQPSWRMKVKSVVLSPQPDQTLAADREHIVSGVAFNDGAARIDSVLISFDRGRTWRRTRLATPESPYAWYRWTSTVKLPAGRHEIWTRAIDALGRSQPLDGSIHWNPSGYEWNGVEKIPVTVTS